MRCVKCGQELPDDANFCRRCGSPTIRNMSYLVQKARENDQEALAEIYKISSPAVYKTIRVLIKDEDTVYDILQDTYVKAFTRLDQLQNPDKLIPWLKMIANNLAKDWLKKSKPVFFTDIYGGEELEDIPFEESIEDVRSELNPEMAMDQQEAKRLVMEILDHLPEDQRVVIGMFYYEEMSVKDIAQTLGVSENTVKSRLSYGRKKIKEQVMDLEKRGTKLYSVAPFVFFLYLLGKADKVSAEPMVQKALLDIMQSYFREASGRTAFQAGVAGNSWGNNIGDNGYFWVSYQDKSLIPSCTIRSYEEVSDDDTIYNLDESGALYPQVTYDGTSQVGFINSFSLKKREKLKEVTFYEAETGAQYQLFYVPVKDDGSLDIGNKQAITEKKTLDFPGYHTEKITKEINVKKAAIMVMIDSNEDSAGLGAEGSISDGRKKLYIPTLEKGQSYIYANGELGDLYDMGTNFGNWSIKLVTEKADSAFYAKDHKNSTDLGSFRWTGRSVKPSIGDIVSEDDGSVLKQGTDYELEYENNTNPGTATVKITGLGKYAKCSLTFTYTIENKTFHINGKKDGDSLDDKDWTGEEIKPSVGNVLSDYDNRVLEEGTDYKLVYSDNINVGTATVKVVGMGDYEGCNLTFVYKIAESCGYNGFYVENASDKSDLGSVKWTGDPIRKKPGTIRCSHCKKELTEGTDYELLETQYCEGDAAKAQTIAENYITEGVVGIFGANEGAATGTGNAIKASGSDEIVGVGFDKSDTLKGLIEDGYLVCTMAQNPDQMGKLGVQACIKALNGEDLGGEVTDCGIILQKKAG